MSGAIHARGAEPAESTPVARRAQADPVATAIPRATYRLQFHAGFRLAEAIELVPYLARLGISHLYASPLLTARPGSTHGYDIVDHDAINPEIGTREELETLAARLREHGMGLVLDIVPNHMGVGSDNAWWMDVLEHGPASERAEFFDVDWRPAKPELRGRVLLPVLGDHYGAVLDRGELVLELGVENGLAALHLRYWESRFPLDPATYPDVLASDLATLRRELADDPDTLARFESLATAFAKLPSRDADDAAARAERARDGRLHRQALADLLGRSPALRDHVQRCVAAFGAAAARPRLHALLEQQAWRLAFWRTAADEINYRRFFDINDLAGLRQEQPDVFEATHRKIAELVEQGIVQGLRIDHPDGLRDPAGYYAQLSDRMARALGRDPAAGLPVYVVAEKILQSYERLPREWAVHGTTGYDFVPLLTGWLTYAPAERQVFRTYAQFTGLQQDLDDELYAARKLVMKAALGSELTVLANRMNRLSEADVHTRDYTLNALRGALAEVAACFPVYRTYVTAADGAGPDDRRYVDWAIAQARKRSTAVDVSVFDFVRRVLLLEGFDDASPDVRREAVGVAMRFQQFTAPLMAKGFEDTVLYRFHALVALNEVGGTPRRYHTSTGALHKANADRARDWPHSMLASSTHDTKRAEDVRARLCVLTEHSDEWRRRVQRWAQLNHRRKRRPRADTAWPGPRIEYLLYQILIGTWPDGDFDRAAYRERIYAYALKAAREAKTHTSWINVNAEYEAALRAFVDALVADGGGPFLADFEPFAREIAWFGALASLSQHLLKLASPGVPDVYQGTELLDFSLVDPDNRRAVDYAVRRAMLETAVPGGGAPPRSEARAWLERPGDGRAKFHLTVQALRLRAAHPRLFRDGTYVPLDVRGSHAEHVCAFLRTDGDDAALVVATRWHATLTERAMRLPHGREIWGDTCIALPEAAAREWRCVLAGTRLAAEAGTLSVGDVLADWPVALLAAN
jgi:(1->4)-alpha-D-glucan 1-alpha-D-glucosylmutase